MTFTIEQTPEQQAVTEIETELAALHQERETYLNTATDPRHPRPLRTLSEIRDEIEILETRLTKAREAAAQHDTVEITSTKARELIYQAVADTKNGRVTIEKAAQELEASATRLQAAIKEYNTTLARNRRNLINAGIPAEGAELDGEPIDLTARKIEYNEHRLTQVADSTLQNYLMAFASNGNHTFPRSPAGWSYIADSYRKGTYWKRATN